VAGVIFSATFVTMQLASSSYTPRVVQALSRRWVFQVVLGTFLGSFAYSIVVLRAVRPASTENPAEFVPVISVSVCVLFSMVSVGVLIYYISFGMRSLQPAFLIDSAARETVNLLESRRADLSQLTDPMARNDERFPSGEGWQGRAKRAGFVQYLELPELLQIASENDLIIRLDREVGRFCLEYEQLVEVWPAETITDEIGDAILDQIVLGNERTPEQDADFGFRRVADIMLKALSPAINDPTTAEYCINRLGELVVLLAGDRPEDFAVIRDENDVVRIIVSEREFERCVNTAFSQLRFYARSDTTVALYTLDVLNRTTELISPRQQNVLRRTARQFVQTVIAYQNDPYDRAELELASTWIGDS
jgi:uncharacterized membrane protein